MRDKFCLLLMAILLVLGGCRRASQTILSLQGSTTILPVAQAGAEAFEQIHPEITISVRGGGSGVGITGLIAGTIDIALSSRRIKPEEIERAREKGFEPKPWIIAQDGLAITVHPSNPIAALTLDQLRKIYTAEITNWEEVGGKDLKITIVSRDVASGTYEVFKEFVLADKALSPTSLMLGSNKEVLTTVSDTPGAIGYIGLGYVSPQVKVLKVDGVLSTSETIKSGQYKLARPLFFYSRGEPGATGKEFIQFMLSREGQKIVSAQGFVPIKELDEKK